MEDGAKMEWKNCSTVRASMPPILSPLARLFLSIATERALCCAAFSRHTNALTKSGSKDLGRKKRGTPEGRDNSNRLAPDTRIEASFSYQPLSD